MDELFLFEYGTCGAFAELEPSITVEGMGMFKTLLSGFENVISFIDSRITGFDGLPRVGSYEELWGDSLEDADVFLVIAPESDGELYKLTAGAERSGCQNIGSNSRAVEVAGDKLATYRALRGLTTPETRAFNGSASTALDFPLIAKPRDGVSCEGISLVRDEEELKGVPEGYLLQEYVEGRAASASLLVGDETRILSLNTQEIENFTYRGGRVPFETDADCEEIIKAVERIKGLFGYVGVDVILNEHVNIIEVNPRPTTPIIALNEVYGFNISRLILDNYYREGIPEFKAKKSVLLRKGQKRQDSFVSSGDYSIWMEK